MLGFVPLSVIFVLDYIGVLTSRIVLFISGNVLLFRNTYMEEELFKSRFNFIVVLFILSMNLLIFIPHLIALLIG